MGKRDCDYGGFGGLFGNGCEWIWIIIIILILCPGIFGGFGRNNCCDND